MKPITPYIRFSTSQQGKSGLGMEAQREALSRFAGSLAPFMASKTHCLARTLGLRPLSPLLIFLICCHPETGRRMTLEDLVHNMQYFIVAGHETTALAISWALYLFANVPECQDRARTEAMARLDGRVAIAEDLDAVPFIRQILEEAMRLYPPVGLLARTILKEDELCGRIMRPNDTVFLPIWALHRHEMWWDRPKIFDPERFSPANTASRNKYQHLPFGAGPRGCVGANFAMMQAQITLATWCNVSALRQTSPLPAQ